MAPAEAAADDSSGVASSVQRQLFAPGLQLSGLSPKLKEIIATDLVFEPVKSSCREGPGAYLHADDIDWDTVMPARLSRPPPRPVAVKVVAERATMARGAEETARSTEQVDQQAGQHARKQGGQLSRASVEEARRTVQEIARGGHADPRRRSSGESIAGTACQRQLAALFRVLVGAMHGGSQRWRRSANARQCDSEMRRSWRQ